MVALLLLRQSRPLLLLFLRRSLLRQSLRPLLLLLPALHPLQAVVAAAVAVAAVAVAVAAVNRVLLPLLVPRVPHPLLLPFLGRKDGAMSLKPIYASVLERCCLASTSLPPPLSSAWRL